MCMLFTHCTHRNHRVAPALGVNGRAGIGDVELTENEWSRACNLRERYWSYVVYDCGTSDPRLLRIRDPFYKLIATAKGGVIIPGKVYQVAPSILTIFARPNIYVRRLPERVREVIGPLK
jgi:hypothetical protein